MKLPRLAPLATLALLALAPGTPAQGQLTTPLDDDALETFRWRSVGPSNMGGRITDVEGLPSPSKTFYVAAASGGIWKTTNNGITFRSIFDEPRVAAMGDIAIAPSDPDQVWAGTGEEDSRNSISAGGGIYKSTDGGETWEFKGLRETQVIGRIVVHPENPDVVWVAALGHIWDHNPERGLYRTTDGGETWELVKFISDAAGFVDIALHPEDPDVLFASSWERVRGPYFLESGGPGSALWKSTDGGETWAEVTGGGFPTALKGRIGLAISESYPRVMYALVEAEEEEDGSGGTGLYRSDDGGESWEKMNDISSRPFYYSQVRVDPGDPDRIYWSSTPVQFSDDGGETVGQTTLGIHVDHHAMWIDPNDPDRIVVGNDGGVAISFDKGGNWHYLNNMALGQFYHVSYGMGVPYTVCGGLQDNGTWCGPSRVENGDVSKYHWATYNGGDGFYTAQDPEEPNILFAESQGGNMARIDMATGERTGLEKPDWEEAWRPLQDTIVTLLEEGLAEDDPRIRDLRSRASADSAALEMRYNWNTPFLISPHDRRVFYAGASRVLKSTDRGENLEPISPDLSYADPEKIEISTNTTGGITVDNTGAETYGTITALDESPLVEGMLFAGTDDGRVWMTRDGGGDWLELTDRFDGVPDGTYVSRIEPSSHAAERFYVTFDGHRTNDFTPYVYVTDDGGDRFRSIASDLPSDGPDFLHVVREDPVNPHLLFVGSDVGAYVSTDRGGSWQRFMTGLPTVPVHDLKIHPRDRELIAATHGRSIWIVDIAPLQELHDEILASEAHLFEPDPAFQWGEPPRGGESYGHAWFERPTPGSEAEIRYWVSEELADRLGDEARERAEEVEAAQGGEMAAEAEARPRAAGRQAGPGGPGGGQSRMARAEIVIEGPDGEVVRTLTGPASDGFHRVTWNFRGEAPEREPLSPSERRDSLRIAERARVVRDSLVEAGWDEGPLDRMVGMFTGESDPRRMFGGFGGGGFQGRDPEAFVERPGESMGGGRGGMGFNYGQIRELGDLIMPGASVFSLFRGGGQAEVAEPASFTVVLKLGDVELRRPLTVERVNGSGGGGGFFEDDATRLERLFEGGR
jgi:photosystem II stability/assembly factor-like uncharacterized protein